MFKKKYIEQPQYYWEKSSYIIAITDDEEKDLLKEALNILQNSKEFKIIEDHIDTIKQTITMKLKYQKEVYEIGFFVGNINVPPYYLNNIPVSPEEKERIQNSHKGLTIFMSFNKDFKKSFFIELKLATLLVPNLMAIIDESAERLFPRQWVKMTTTSKELPSAKDLFSIQAIIGKNNQVWLHTHGLARCGLTELEILDSPKEMSQHHFNILNTYAMYLIDKKEPTNEKASYIGLLSNNHPIVVTSVPWTEALCQFKNLKTGGKLDRKNGHNSRTSIIFLYKNEEDEQNDIVSKVSIYDDLWMDNPLFFISDEETKRMKNVAIERFDYVKKAFKNKNSILLKIGLPMKEKGQFEHIWFEILELKDDKFKARLTQEPYYFPDIHVGYENWYQIEDITDWIIYTEKYTITPDNAYILDQE